MKKVYAFLLLFISTTAFAQNPIVIGDTMLCPNGVSVLSTQTFDTYQWFVRPFGSSTISPIPGATSQFLPVDYANYVPSYISVEVTAGANDYISSEVLVDGYVFAGCTVSSTGEFTIGPLGEAVLCPGDTMYFEILLPYDTMITWFKDGDTIPGINSTILTVTEPGSYYVTGAPRICPMYIEGPGVSLDVIDCPVGVEENLGEKISIYPNPAKSSIQIINAKLNSEFRIIDATGKLTKKGKITSDKMIVDIESFASGNYFFESDKSTISFIKK